MLRQHERLEEMFSTETDESEGIDEELLKKIERALKEDKTEK